jgi:CRP-like cAMP-binding protein
MTFGNQLLDALCRERPMLARQVRLSRPPVGHEFYAHGETVRSVHFPTTGVLSVQLLLSSGHGAEAHTVGNEGFVGLPVYLGLSDSSYRVLQQVPGEVLSLPAREFCSEIEGSEVAARVLKRYTAYALQFSIQNCVCNLHHSVSQRASRWLLTTADRVGDGRIELTQELLAGMLGARRQSVGEIAVTWQRQGLIQYRRGVLRIVDRPALEAVACECYEALRRYRAETLGPSVV